MTTLVYGGTGGIGSVIARQIVAAGGRVHLAARDEARLEALAGELGCGYSRCDVEDAESLRRAASEAGERIDALVYAVGTIQLKPISRLTAADIERDFRVNALGAALAVQAALPALRQAPGGGAVLLFSTVAVGQGFPAHASVAMAKGAVEGLSRALAAELAPKVRVNCIAPSLTRTPLAASLMANEQVASAIAALHPLGRLGEPEDVAELAVFLLSERAAWITGQTFGVDGGRSRLRTKG